MARPRSEEARRKVLEATAELIIEGGVAKLTMEEVAARSGVAKTTIYRHWPERPALILDTVGRAFRHVATPDTGSLRGDLLAFFNGMVRADLSGKVGRMMPCLIDAATRDPEMEQLLARLGVEREGPVVAIVGRAQQRGELPMDLDQRVVVGTIVGPIVFRKVIQRQQIDSDYIERCVDVAVTGLGASVPAAAVPS
ncbi:MAG: TetR/AcrR family transcriptional regulator [Ilumatobacteraceae bacterium]